MMFKSFQDKKSKKMSYWLRIPNYVKPHTCKKIQYKNNYNRHKWEIKVTDFKGFIIGLMRRNIVIVDAWFIKKNTLSRKK